MSDSFLDHLILEYSAHYFSDRFIVESLLKRGLFSFYNQDGFGISYEKCQELMKDKNYCVVKKTSLNLFFVTTKWMGFHVLKDRPSLFMSFVLHQDSYFPLKKFYCGDKKDALGKHELLVSELSR